MSETSRRCRGHCCKKFTLSCEYEEIKELAARPDACPDDVKLADMLIPLGRGSMRPTIADERWHLYDMVDPERGGELPELFTCRHLQESGDCGIYDERPQMCRNYPDSGTCNYSGCQASCSFAALHTAQAAREPAQPSP